MRDSAQMLDWQQQEDGEVNEQFNSIARQAAKWAVVHRPLGRGSFQVRVEAARLALLQLEKKLAMEPSDSEGANEKKSAHHAALNEMRSSPRILRTALAAVSARPNDIAELPRIVHPDGMQEPRVAVLAAAYLRAVRGEFLATTLRALIERLQQDESLNLQELWHFAGFIRFALLELILKEAGEAMHGQPGASTFSIATLLKSLRTVTNADIPSLIEPLIAFDGTLRADPAMSYEHMDFESREQYRKRVALVARYSDSNEITVARIALELAREAASRRVDDSRIRHRNMHIGFYLQDKGFPLLAERVGFHPPMAFRAREFVRLYGEDFYITGIQILTVLLLAAAVFPVLPHIHSIAAFAFLMIVLLLPVSQDAVELINHAVTAFFDPDPLPKLNFRKGIPHDCATLVAVPSLLLNEQQVAGLLKGLEVRYLANRSPNLHFALLTDLADSVSKPRDNDSHPLVELAARRIDELNARYGAAQKGSFLLLHRHRVFNRRQGVWMGWERKRGKLLDLNKLLAGEYDAFPVKAGHLDVLQDVRYILTLDADTELPRDAAARLVGTIAHPLNKAVVDPKRRIVTSGYGILQPRIGVSVRSTAGSRLAAIYSGQSGLDIYTRAISDAYQDLFGEGIFTGKGIYEVETFHTVLKGRFPRNALLSHDLIEGAYLRAGLATDVELIDDHPSHYSAYSRRKHRWVRGDWQIAQWMFSRVPDETGASVPNPISSISRWKILDNLRRSLVDPFLFLLFAAGWLGLPGGPLYWTTTTIVLLLLPSLARLALDLGRALAEKERGRVSSALSGFSSALEVSAFHLILLPREMVVAVDAIFRAMVRRFVTGERLLEWETAAQVELRLTNNAPHGWHLLVVPSASLALGALIWFAGPRPAAILCAAPILALWALGDAFTLWLNRPPRKPQKLSPPDEAFLRGHALLIWRYFQQFSSPRHNYLIPDNVEEVGLFEAARVSPTNIGLLLNARQAACAMGFITIPEFVQLTQRSLATIGRLEKFHGHLHNWYDTETLRPLKADSFISSVDSGNFVASLYTLSAGARDLARTSLLSPGVFDGLRICWRMMGAENTIPVQVEALPLPALSAPVDAWVDWLAEASSALADASAGEGSGAWLVAEMQARVAGVHALIHDYLPWMEIQYEALRSLPDFSMDDNRGSFSIKDAIFLAEVLEVRVARLLASLPSDSPLRDLALTLGSALGAAIHNLQGLAAALAVIADEAQRLAEATEFDFLVDPGRQILSIGFETGPQKIHQACYDMLASEARIATFLAIARGDLPLQSWSKLSRDHVFAKGRFLLLSWTGTMFEYLMPALWMRSYNGTLLARTQDACVAVQREFGRSRGIPWGISESGASPQDAQGHYHYQAYGIPSLALWFEATAGPVISPYSTFLALTANATEAIRNLRRMDAKGWVGAYGFYESADYTKSLRTPVLTREWMAHHQGMALLAITNLLCGNAVQRWFHQNSLVQATELILQELAPNKGVLKANLREVAPIRSS